MVAGNRQSWIGYHVSMPVGASIREQHLHQEALAVLLLNNANQYPGVRACGLKVQFLDRFGDFAIGSIRPPPLH